MQTLPPEDAIGWRGKVPIFLAYSIVCATMLWGALAFAHRWMIAGRQSAMYFALFFFLAFLAMIAMLILPLRMFSRFASWRFEKAADAVQQAPPPEFLENAEVKYGPNWKQVTEFLSRMWVLTQSEWDMILRRVAPRRVSFVKVQFTSVRYARAVQSAHHALTQSGRAEAVGQAHFALKEAAARGMMPSARPPEQVERTVGNSLTRVTEFDVFRAAYCACWALVVRDQIPTKHFRILYAPFERAIPVAVLDDRSIGHG
jgi:hypothetical protein